VQQARKTHQCASVPQNTNTVIDEVDLASAELHD